MSENLFQKVPAEAIEALCHTLNDIRNQKTQIDTDHHLYQKLLRQTTAILHAIQGRTTHLNIHNREFDLSELTPYAKSEVIDWLNELVKDCDKRHVSQRGDPQAVPRLLKVEIIRQITSENKQEKFNNIYNSLMTASKADESLLSVGYDKLTQFNMPGVSPEMNTGAIMTLFAVIAGACFALYQKCKPTYLDNPGPGLEPGPGPEPESGSDTESVFSEDEERDNFDPDVYHGGGSSDMVVNNNTPYGLKPRKQGLLDWLAVAGSAADDENDPDFEPDSNDTELYTRFTGFTPDPRDLAVIDGEEEDLRKYRTCEYRNFR